MHGLRRGLASTNGLICHRKGQRLLWLAMALLDDAESGSLARCAFEHVAVALTCASRACPQSTHQRRRRCTDDTEAVTFDEHRRVAASAVCHRVRVVLCALSVRMAGMMCIVLLAVPCRRRVQEGVPPSCWLRARCGRPVLCVLQCCGRRAGATAHRRFCVNRRYI